jgi:6-phosphofructokinase 1
MKKIAFLTSGGDAPGMNAAIRSIVKTCLHFQITPYAIYDGFQGMIEGRGKVMDKNDVENCIQLGGTIIGTARCKDFMTLEGRGKAIEFLRKEEIDGLIVIGGDGTFAGAMLLGKEMNIPIIGIPGTIDNDINGTDFTIGFDTALNTVISSIDKIRDTASSHHRVFFVEAMGKDAGSLAIDSALGSAIETVLIPEEQTDIMKLVGQIKLNSENKKPTIVIVAEGDDAGNSSIIIEKVKPYLEGVDIKQTILGHIQRGGSPSAFDRLLGTSMGNFAVNELIAGKTNKMVSMKNNKICLHDLNNIGKSPLDFNNKLRIIEELADLSE